MDTKLTVTIVDPTTTMARILSSKLVHKISVRQQRDENISSSPIVFSFFTNALIVFLMKPGRCFIILSIIRRPYSAIPFCVRVWVIHSFKLYHFIRLSTISTFAVSVIQFYTFAILFSRRRSTLLRGPIANTSQLVLEVCYVHFFRPLGARRMFN